MPALGSPAVAFQPSLFDLDLHGPAFDPVSMTIERRLLAGGAWLDHGSGWLRGAGDLFDEVRAAAPWAAYERPMYDRLVVEPRLTTQHWVDPPAVVREMAAGLSEHYGRDLGVVSANLYRDGRDSVAWHGDRVGRLRAETVVAIVSLGAPRRFLLRPKGGGESLRLRPLAGSLLVMGGTCQRTWEHTVPKCAHAGSRVSLMFREAY